MISKTTRRKHHGVVPTSPLPIAGRLLILFLLPTLAALSVLGQSTSRKNAAQYARELMNAGTIASSQRVATMVCFSDDESVTSFFTLNPAYESTFYPNGSPTKPSFGDDSDQSVVGITLYEKGIPDIYSFLGQRSKSTRREVAVFEILGTKERASLLLMQIVTSTWNFRISGGVSEAAASQDWHGFLGKLYRDPAGLSNPGITVNGHCEAAPMCKTLKQDGYCASR